MDNQNNAFEQGVAVGGLRNTLQIKVLIEYIIDTLNGPITSDLLIETISGSHLANYFEVAQAIEDLVSNGTIEKNELGFLSLTTKGEVTLRELINDIPFTVRELAVSEAKSLISRTKNLKFNDVEIVPIDSGFNVIFKVIHDDSTVLMKIELYATDFESAELIKTRIFDNPSGIYSTVIERLCN